MASRLLHARARARLVRASHRLRRASSGHPDVAVQRSCARRAAGATAHRKARSRIPVLPLHEALSSSAPAASQSAIAASSSASLAAICPSRALRAASRAACPMYCAADFVQAPRTLPTRNSPPGDTQVSASAGSCSAQAIDSRIAAIVSEWISVPGPTVGTVGSAHPDEGMHIWRTSNEKDVVWCVRSITVPCGSTHASSSPEASSAASNPARASGGTCGAKSIELPQRRAGKLASECRIPRVRSRRRTVLAGFKPGRSAASPRCSSSTCAALTGNLCVPCGEALFLCQPHSIERCPCRIRATQ